MNEALRKNEKYITKYMRKNVMLTLLLNKAKDEDIINFLENQDNKSKVVRRAIRAYMNAQEPKTNWIDRCDDDFLSEN